MERSRNAAAGAHRQPSTRRFAGPVLAPGRGCRAPRREDRASGTSRPDGRAPRLLLGLGSLSGLSRLGRFALFALAFGGLGLFLLELADPTRHRAGDEHRLVRIVEVRDALELRKVFESESAAHFEAAQIR